VTTYSGKVIDGKVAFDGDPPPEGAEVLVEVLDEGEGVWVTPDMEAELLEAIARMDRGEGIPAEQVLAAIRRPRGGTPSQ
jgi:hypothetical protein